MSLSQIMEGWRNNLIPPAKLKQLIKETSRERMAICEQCPHHSKHHKSIRPDEHCTYCGCTLKAKTKCLSCKCPINKWVALLSEEDEEQMKKTIKDEKSNKA